MARGRTTTDVEVSSINHDGTTSTTAPTTTPRRREGSNTLRLCVGEQALAEVSLPLTGMDGLSFELTRMWSDITGRLTGPLTFRLILQPAMAAFYAVRDGIGDAKSRKPAYFWSILSNPSGGTRLLVEGWHAVARVALLATIMDVIYQLVVFRRLHPLELVIVVLTLAFVPYLLLRGPVNRIARHWM